MSVGDINSTAKGSGARFNDGKAPLEFIPLRSLLHYKPLGVKEHWWQMMHLLAEFEERKAGIDEVLRLADMPDYAECAFVFKFGAEKYAAWNWAKGMDWSIPLACIKRHWLAIANEEFYDPESDRHHWGHIMCNIVMLDHFTQYWVEGDDLPPPELFHATTKS